MPAIRAFDWRNRCINCALLMRRPAVRHVVSEVLTGPMINILRSWINPTQLTQECIICMECLRLLQERANNYIEGEVVPLPALGHKRVCYPCGISILRSVRTYPVRHNRAETNFLLQLVPLHLVSRIDRVCAACWKAAMREVSRQRPTIEPTETDTISEQHTIPAPPALPPVPTRHPVVNPPKIISRVYKRAANTSTRCIFSNCIQNERLLVPSAIKEWSLLNHKFYIPVSARVCRHHLEHGSWDELTSDLNDFTGQQFDRMLKLIQKASSYKLDFSNIESMPSHLCHYWIGINASQFNDLLNSLPSLATHVPNPAKALSILLVKLRTGDSDERLSTLFNMSRSTLERWMGQTRNCFLNDFVPINLGFRHMSVEDVASRNRIIPEGLFGNPDLPPNVKPAIVICDATYVFLQNSSNYLFQKQTYSLHKLDNLVKPFMIVCCDGHILECLGPYKATTNDATITSLNLRNEDGMSSFFRNGDVFLLDRGFRDVSNELQNHGYVPHMPESLLEDEHQLTTQQANRSRFVTMCRWVVEAVNGRIKRDFKIFRYVFNNRAAMHLMADFRICCSLLNKFQKEIEDPPEALEYVRIAKERLPLDNYLSNYVNRETLNRRSANFETIDSHHPHLNNFPRLTLSDLKYLALGTYQLRQAKSYYGEHIRSSGIYSIQVNKEIEEDIPLVLGINNYMLRGRIKSRHVTSRTYYVYLLINKDVNVANTLGAIAGYCCSCLVGRRTVGCCAHVMSVVWYLSWGRYNDISAPAPYLDHFFDEVE